MLRRSLAVLIFLVFAGAIAAQEGPTLETARGQINKVDKESLTIRPRGADGKFEKAVMLKLTGTSKISTLTTQKRGGKVVNVQRDTDPKDLQPKQAIAVIYSKSPAGMVLLAAVVHGE